MQSATVKVCKFSATADVSLLTEVVGWEGGNPFDYGSKAWVEIAKRLSDGVPSLGKATERTVRERALVLVKDHSKDDAWKKRQNVNNRSLFG